MSLRIFQRYSTSAGKYQFQVCRDDESKCDPNWMPNLSDAEYGIEHGNYDYLLTPQPRSDTSQPQPDTSEKGIDPRIIIIAVIAFILLLRR